MQSLTQLKNALLAELEAHKADVLALPENLEEYVNQVPPESVMELGQLALSEPDIRLFGGEAADAVEEMFQGGGLFDVFDIVRESLLHQLRIGARAWLAAAQEGATAHEMP